MKKSYKLLTDKVCTYSGCSKRLKQNLVDKNPKAELCFTHWVLTKIPHLANKRLHLKQQPKEVPDESIQSKNC